MGGLRVLRDLGGSVGSGSPATAWLRLWDVRGVEGFCSHPRDRRLADIAAGVEMHRQTQGDRKIR